MKLSIIYLLILVIYYRCGTMEKIRLCNDGYIKLNWISREMLGIPLGHRVSIIDAYEYSGETQKMRRNGK